MTATAATIAPGLTFNEREHLYELDGHRLPSVTQILAGMGLVSGSEFFTEAAKARGKAVHAAVHYLLKGTLNWKTVDPRLEPYLKAFGDFLASGFEPVGWETPLASRRHGYAGTPDLFGLWRGLEAVPDFKSGIFQKHHPIQIAGYARLLHENGWGFPQVRMVVSLKPDGRFAISQDDNPAQSDALWLAALNLYHWKESKA